MSKGVKLRSAAVVIKTASEVLRNVTNAQPALERYDRILQRIVKAANRPPRIGIMGERNSGKSSIANLLVGMAILPTHPVKDTRLPTLLKYSSAPFVIAHYDSGERINFPVNDDNISQVLADVHDNGGINSPQINANIPQGIPTYLEVGLPSEILRLVEILDFPDTTDVLFPGNRKNPVHYKMDAAIWTTVATQAWRASEKTQWLKLPEAIRLRGLLAVTHCDMISGGEGDAKKLHARLEVSAMPYFQASYFIDASDENPAAAVSMNKSLFMQTQYLAQELSAIRQNKALTISQRVMRKAIEKMVILGPDRAQLLASCISLAVTQRAIKTSPQYVGFIEQREAIRSGSGFGEDGITNQSGQYTQARSDKPSILFNVLEAS